MTGSSAASQKAAAANPFAHYGNITLNVWSADNQDPGPEPVIKALAASFSKKYPNVTVKLKFYDFNSYIKIVKLSLNSANAPDVAEGNQGYQIDSAARQGEADPAARQVRGEVRLGQAVHAGHGAAVPLDPRRQDVRQGQPLGRRAVRPVGRRVLQQGARQEVRRQSRQHAEDVRGLQRAAGQAPRQRARRRADHQHRQQGRLRGTPRVRDGAGRVRPGPVHPQLDLPRRRAARGHRRPTSRR